MIASAHNSLAALALEAAALGLFSGPACLASCGPVLAPTLLAQPRGWRSNTRWLGAFLGARLVGYLLFAAVAASLGMLIHMPIHLRAMFYGSVQIAMALALTWHAWRMGGESLHLCAAPMAGEDKASLVQIGAAPQPNTFLRRAALLGLLTGLSLCPPFLAAGARAVELGSIPLALAFFLIFFVGATVWFLPFAGLAALRRSVELIAVARMSIALIAAYYLLQGIHMLTGGL